VAQKRIDGKSFSHDVMIGGIYTPQCYPADEGFFVVLTEYKGAKYGYEVMKLNESLKFDWRKVLVPKKGVHGVITAKEAHGQLALVVFKRDKLLTREASGEIMVLSSATGEKVLSYDLTDQKYTRLALSVFVDDDGSIITGGNYWEGTKLKGNPDGVFFLRIGTDGEKLLEAVEPWEEGLGKKVDASSNRGLFSTKPFLMFQTVEKAANGNYIVVGESYYNAVSAAGTATAVGVKVLAAAAGGSARTEPTIDIVVEDFILLEFDKNSGAMKSVTAVAKERNRYTATVGYAGFAGALYLNYYGLFDYVYTQKDADGSPVLVYYDRKKGQPYLGFINISVGSNVKVDKHNLNKKAEDTWVVESKPGHYLIYEYEKKDKTLTMSVEKL